MAAQRTVLIALAALSCVLMQSADALTHVVGGECGWEIPPNPNFYADWAKPRTFGLGDKLVFPYRIVSHDVLQVEKDDFDTCGHKHVINQFYKGPTVIQLNNTGDYYFYSGVGTHCELGQKLHITVGTGPGSDGKFTFTPARRLLLGAAEHGDAKKDAAGEKESAAGEKESAAGEKESAAPAPGPAGEAAPAAASAAPTTAAQIFGALASCLAVLILI